MSLTITARCALQQGLSVLCLADYCGLQSCCRLTWGNAGGRLPGHCDTEADVIFLVYTTHCEGSSAIAKVFWSGRSQALRLPNAVIALVRREPRFMERARVRSPSEFDIPSIAAHELYFGAYRSSPIEENLERIDYLRFPSLSSTAKMLRKRRRCAHRYKPPAHRSDRMMRLSPVNRRRETLLWSLAMFANSANRWIAHRRLGSPRLRPKLLPRSALALSAARTLREARIGRQYRGRRSRRLYGSPAAKGWRASPHPRSRYLKAVRVHACSTSRISRPLV